MCGNLIVSKGSLYVYLFEFAQLIIRHQFRQPHKRTESGRGGEIQLTDALKVLVKQQNMYAYDFIGIRYDVGDKQGYLEATVEYALRREDLKDKFLEYLKGIVD